MQRQVGEGAGANCVEAYPGMMPLSFRISWRTSGRAIAESLSPSSPLSDPMRHHGPISCREEEWR